MKGAGHLADRVKVLRHPCAACGAWRAIEQLTWVSPAYAVCARASQCQEKTRRLDWLR